MVLRLSSRSALRSLSVVQLKSGGQLRGVYVFAARDVKLIPSSAAATVMSTRMRRMYKEPRKMVAKPCLLGRKSRDTG